MAITEKQAMVASEAAAKAVAAAFKAQGYKLLGSPNTNGWGQSSLVIEMAGMRVLVEIGVQAMPRGLDMFIEFQSPLTKQPDDYDRWERIAPVLQGLVQQASKNFEGFGKLKVDMKGRGGEAGWPYLWIYPTPDKEQVAVDQFASRAGDFAEIVARKLKAAGVLEDVVPPMGEILARLEEGAFVGGDLRMQWRDEYLAMRKRKTRAADANEHLRAVAAWGINPQIAYMGMEGTRDEIDAKLARIRANVQDEFIVVADDAADGRMVGEWGHGAKKIRWF